MASAVFSMPFCRETYIVCGFLGMGNFVFITEFLAIATSLEFEQYYSIVIFGPMIYKPL